MDVNSRRSANTKRDILVTGGAGFIGSHVVDRLLAEGSWRVIVVDNFDPFYDPAIKRSNIAAHNGNPDFKLYEVDVCHREKLQAVFAAHDFVAIVHLASRAGVRPSVESPQSYIDTNVTGTLNILECARQHDVKRIVFGSSSSVYGLSEDGAAFQETDDCSKPISPYAASKASAEMLCHTYAHLYKLRCVCLRFFTVYGARQRPDLAIHKFARLIHEGKPIPLFGDGSSRRDYTFVDDIVQGVVGAIELTRDTEKELFEIVNLGESQTIELRRLVNLLERALEKKAVIDWRDNQPGDVPITYADISKARRLLKYKPQTKIEEGIPRFVDWFLGSRGQPRRDSQIARGRGIGSDVAGKENRTDTTVIPMDRSDLLERTITSHTHSQTVVLVD